MYVFFAVTAHLLFFNLGLIIKFGVSIGLVEETSERANADSENIQYEFSDLKCSYTHAPF